MASHITDPKDFVLHIRGELLSEYLKKCQNLDFPAGKEDEEKEELADRFMKYMKDRCDKRQRASIYTQFNTVNDLSSVRHLDNLYKSSAHIERNEIIDARGKNNDEKALLAFINYPDEFENYHTQAWLEEKSLREFSLPASAPPMDITAEKKLPDFQKLVKDFYQKEYIGDECKAKLFTDGEKFILRVYVQDMEREEMVFKDNKIVGQPISPIFDVVFIYKKDLSMLGVYAASGKNDEKALAKMFGLYFLGVELSTEPIRYKLGSIKDITNLNLSAPNLSYGIERAYLKSIRLRHKDIPHRILIDVAGRQQYTGSDEAQKILEEIGMDKNMGWEPCSITIAIVFKQVAEGRRKQVSVVITPPNTCTLKNREQDDIVRKFLKDLGIYIA
jgi:hypothetical protein